MLHNLYSTSVPPPVLRLTTPPPPRVTYRGSWEAPAPLVRRPCCRTTCVRSSPPWWRQGWGTSPLPRAVTGGCYPISLSNWLMAPGLGNCELLFYISLIAYSLDTYLMQMLNYLVIYQKWKKLNRSMLNFAFLFNSLMRILYSIEILQFHKIYLSIYLIEKTLNI